MATSDDRITVECFDLRGQAFGGTLDELFEGGCRVRGPLWLAVGDSLEMELAWPDRSILVAGRVLWIERRPGQRTASWAVEFVGPALGVCPACRAWFAQAVPTTRAPEPFCPECSDAAHEALDEVELGLAG